MMKRIFALGLSILLLFTTVACGGSEKKESTAAKSETTTKAGQIGSEKENATTEAEATTKDDSSDDEDSVKLDNSSWTKFYEYYAQEISGGYDRMSELPADANVSLFYLDLISGDIDLAFTSTFFDKDAASILPAMYGMFGYADIKYQENGDTATATMKGKDGKEVVQTLRYDGKSSAEFSTASAGVVDFTISICATDAYVAKVYTKGDLSSGMRAVIYKNGDLSLGSNDSKTQVLSLYGNTDAPKDPAFISSMEKQLNFKDGKISTKP